MPIELGLTRITQFLGYMQNPHLKTLSIHIAGTNGKGSTLAYLSSILTVARVRNGKFTSPHIIHYHDCISINNQTYPKDKFDKVYNDVVDLDKKMGSSLTEFELLVATAFKIFEVEKVQISLIETGVGGRLDATNALSGYDRNTNSGVIATAISKISLDHESLLGKGIRNIAKEKAGIMKPGVPCFVDASNEEAVLKVMQESSRDVGCRLTFVQPELSSSFINFSPLKGAYQANNLSLALAILKSLPYKISDEDIKEGISNTHWPGRLQVIEHSKLGKILIDGAHNEGAAIELGKYLRETYKNEPIVFVIGVTRGKEVDGLLKHILKKDDVVVPTLFTQPDNMPWISPEQIAKLADAAGKYSLVEKAGDDVYIRDVFSYLEDRHLGKPIVVCGSLYLCGDVLREI